jgi:hypothetical protein
MAYVCVTTIFIVLPIFCVCSDVERVRAAIEGQYGTHSYQAERKIQANENQVARPLDVVHLTKKYKVSQCVCCSMRAYLKNSECVSFACHHIYTSVDTTRSPTATSP